MSFTCPRCWRTSHNPHDKEHGYCGACHVFIVEALVSSAYTVALRFSYRDAKASTIWDEMDAAIRRVLETGPPAPAIEVAINVQLPEDET